MRHTAGSLAVASGANVKSVQQMLGHASAAMTLDAYAGLFGDDLDALDEWLHEAATRPHVASCGLGFHKDAPNTTRAEAKVPRDLQERCEPPIGVEPMTYALRGRPAGVRRRTLRYIRPGHNVFRIRVYVGERRRTETKTETKMLRAIVAWYRTRETAHK